MRTSIPGIAQQNQAVPDTYRKLQSTPSEAQGANSEQGLFDEFTAIMDKIADRLSQDFGQDYSTVMQLIDVQALQIPVTRVDTNRGNSKVEQEDIHEASENNDEEVEQEESFVDRQSNVTESKKTSQESQNDSSSKNVKDKHEEVAEDNTDLRLPQNIDSKADQLKDTNFEKFVKDSSKDFSSTKQKDQETLNAPDKAQIEEVEESLNTTKLETTKLETNTIVKSDKTDKAKILQENIKVDEASEQPKLNTESGNGYTDSTKNLDTSVQQLSKKQESTLGLLLSAIHSQVQLMSNSSPNAQSNSLVLQQIKDVLVNKIDGSAKVASAPSSANQGNFSGSFGAQNRATETRSERSRTNVNFMQNTKMLERVESALKEAARAKDGKTISLRLDPPSLGTVNFDVSLKDGNLHARIHADATNANLVLREKAHELHASLRKLGLDIESITVAVQSENGQEFRFTGDLDSQSQNNKFELEKDKEEQRSLLANTTSDGRVTIGNLEINQTVLDHWVA
jgi:flagellar hook-length control protein FliK